MNFTPQAIEAFLLKLQPILATHSRIVNLPYDPEKGESIQRSSLRQSRHELMLKLTHDERRMLAAYAKSLHSAAAALIVFDDAVRSEPEPAHDR